VSSPDPGPLVAAIRSELRRHADPARAPQMQAYMKSVMPYRGVSMPMTRRIARAAAARYPPADVDDLATSVGVLWRGASYREERYAATELIGLPIAAGRLELLPLCREMIVTGAWWDHVDGVSGAIGTLLLAHRPVLDPTIRLWSTDPDHWLRRSSIICQLRLRQRTDVELLTAVIVPNLADREFFVRKAIGWALRQYARTDPDWVRSFVAAHEERLSPLSRREAMKHLAPPSRPAAPRALGAQVTYAAAIGCSTGSELAAPAGPDEACTPVSTGG
jgi:3-methyladenine DNA glycosylase AlkD